MDTNQSRWTKLKISVQNHKRPIQISLFVTIIFLSTCLIINPVNAGFGLQELRSQSINEMAIKNGMVWLQATADYLVPEADGEGGIIMTHKLVTFRIPITVQPIPLLPEEFDKSKETALPFNLQEQLTVDYGKFYDSLWFQQIFPTSGEDIVWKDDYPNYTKFTPFVNKPSYYFNKPNNYMQRYQAMVPSPAQFAAIIAKKNGWSLNNVTDAHSRFVTGTGGVRPDYVIESFGAPCDIDNDTSNMIIELKVSNESDAAFTSGYIGTPGMAFQQTFFAQIFDEETDNWAAPLLLGNYIIAGVIPHKLTTVQNMDGENFDTAFIEIMQKWLDDAKAEGDKAKATALKTCLQTTLLASLLSEKEPSKPDVGSQFFFVFPIHLAAQGIAADQAVALIVGFHEWMDDRENKIAEGAWNKGKEYGAKEASRLFWEWFATNWTTRRDVNISDQAMLAMLNQVNHITELIKQDTYNPYSDVGAHANIPSAFKMPSLIQIIIYIAIGLTIGGCLIAVVWYFVIRKRKKKKEAEESGAQASEIPKEPRKGKRARISGAIKSAKSRVKKVFKRKPKPT